MRGNAVLYILVASVAMLCAPTAAAQTQRPQIQQLPTQQRPAPSLPAQQADDPQLPIYILNFPDSPPRIDPPADDRARVAVFANPDNDRDGHRAERVGGDDCDDADPRRAPGLPEVGDWEGHDEDCNFETIGVMDQDRDGFTSWRTSQIWRTSAGRPYAILRGPDCDDQRRDVNPAMPEVMGDQLDNNCDGAIDLNPRPGHRDYCAPANTTRLSQMGLACGEPSGDTRQFRN